MSIDGSGQAPTRHHCLTTQKINSNEIDGIVNAKVQKNSKFFHILDC
jgi:hypothetical protein